MEVCPLCGKKLKNGCCEDCGGSSSAGYQNTAYASGSNRQEDSIFPDAILEKMNSFNPLDDGAVFPNSHTETVTVGKGTFEFRTNCDIQTGETTGAPFSQKIIVNSREVNDLSELSPFERRMVEKSMLRFKTESAKKQEKVIERVMGINRNEPQSSLFGLIFSGEHILNFIITLFVPVYGIVVGLIKAKSNDFDIRRVGNALTAFGILLSLLVFIMMLF